MSRKISILHPFSAFSVGLQEGSIIKYHSKPHALTLKMLSSSHGYTVCIDYFTDCVRGYTESIDNLQYRFYPVRFSFRGDHKKFRKQYSINCLKKYFMDTPDITIINNSGHSSPFSYELSKIILENKKKYIAMLGGQHYSFNKRNIEYYKNADHLLVHTEKQKEKMHSMNLFKNLDIRVFPLGVELEHFKPNLNYNINEKEPKLLYVGRIVELKRINIALDVISYLKSNHFPKVSFDIIGPISSEKYLNDLKEKINKLNLNDNITFLGEKNHSELIPHYKEADLFLLPSEKETFGMVMIEAMACGTPVAAISSPGGPENVIENNFNGIICELEHYAKSIEAFFLNKVDRYSIIKNAIKTVDKNYSIKKTYEVLLNSVIN